MAPQHKFKYRIYSMHGATVSAFEYLSDALKALDRLKNSNGGLYRIVDENSGREIASLDTYATYWPLNYEANHRGKT